MKPWLASLALGLLALSASAQNKIGIIDLSKAFDRYYKTIEATDSLKKRGAEFDKDMTMYTSQHSKATDEYKKAVEEANNMALSADERDKHKKAAEKKLRDIQDLEQSINQFRAQADTTMEEQRRRMRENILGQIRAVVSAKAKTAGYSLVLDTAAESFNKTPIVVYSNGENDLTEAVLQQLNANAPAMPKPGGSEKK